MRSAAAAAPHHLYKRASFFKQDEYKSILLNQRELTGEEMVAKIMDHMEQRLPPDMSTKKGKLFLEE